MSLILSVLPLPLVMSAGYLLAKTQIIPKSQWSAIETLSFRALIPAVLILAIVRSDLSMDHFGGFILALLVTLAVLAALALSFRLLRPDMLSNSAFTTLFQSSVRWNAFVALAAAEQLLTGGIAVIAVAIAVLIPTINVICILVLAGFGPAQVGLKGILSIVGRNPLVQACAIGLTLNWLGVALPQPAVDTLDMIGRAALGVGLMAVGAGISLRRLGSLQWPVLAGAAMRLILSPAVFVIIASLVGLSPLQTMAGVLVFAAPCASNGYIVAKQMGGDAPLYADILTWQTLLSLLVLPFWAYFLV